MLDRILPDKFPVNEVLKLDLLGCLLLATIVLYSTDLKLVM